MKEYDTTGSGTLNIDEIALLLANARNVQIRSTDLEREFKVQMRQCSPHPTTVTPRQAFDKDGNGSIDKEEFRSFSLALEARPAVTPTSRDVSRASLSCSAATLSVGVGGR